MSVLSNKIIEVSEENYQKSLGALADVIEAEMNIALAAEEGYFHSFVLPPRLAGRNYRLEFINSTTLDEDENRNVTVLRVYGTKDYDVDESVYVERMFPGNVFGSGFIKGLNTVRKGGRGQVTFDTELNEGTLSVKLYAPETDSGVNTDGSDSFTLAVSVSCSSDKLSRATCGDVKLTAMQEDDGGSNKEKVPLTGKPFQSQTTNPQYCWSVTAGQTCERSWIIQGTGKSKEYKYFYVQAASEPPYSLKIESDRRKVIINTCPDGTGAGECSVTKPKYCERGYVLKLVNKCDVCGCPDAALKCVPQHGGCWNIGTLTTMQLDAPQSDIDVSKHAPPLTVTATATCTGAAVLGVAAKCGTVSMYVMEKDSSSGTGSAVPASGVPGVPFTTSQNPQTCSVLSGGQTCQKSLEVTATGIEDQFKHLYVKTDTYLHSTDFSPDPPDLTLPVGELSPAIENMETDSKKATIKFCKDNTPPEQCSPGNKPGKCEAPALEFVDDCVTCSCDAWGTCFPAD
ncbi:MAG: hypothetical protein AABX60_02590, partial [Nanoarchaeota archaeon]